MSATVCPTCGSPIDPAHAPIARIRGSRVVTYCSVACADRGAITGDAPAPAPRPASAPAPKKSSARRSAPAAKARPAAPRAEAKPAAPRSRPASPPQSAAEREPATHEGAVATSPRRIRRRVAAICVAIFAGGMAIAIIEAVSPSVPAEVRAADSAAPASGRTKAAKSKLAEAKAEAAKEQAAAAPLAPKQLLRAARTELSGLMKSPSRRVERIAAMALSRVGDKQALATLEQLLKTEPSDLNRIPMAYALARAGVASGRSLLHSALSDDRRDVRVDAARALVKLGDAAGRRTLHAMLALKQYRMGVAVVLARLGDPAGLGVLRKERRRGKSEEIKMRAVVALGLAGDHSVAARLHQILDKGQYEVGAAEALAALGDASATPALTRQLESPYLRVRAALALRRLGRHVDLHPLAAGLTTGDEVDRVSAAEAILILLGPKQAAGHG